MILHSNLPYALDIPNPALGYLKGFLQSHSITVKNVYWNLELSSEISRFNKTLKAAGDNTFSMEALTVYAWKRLMGIKDRTSLSLLFSSVLTDEEIDDVIFSLKEKIDRYILQNNLHREGIHGITVKTYQWLMNWYITSRLKKVNPDITIILGGATCKEQAEAFMRLIPHIDYAIYGEGEYPLLHLVKTLESGTMEDRCSSLVYRGNTLVSTEPCAASEDLDSFAFADHTDYFDAVKSLGLAGMRILIPIWGSRSCPWNKCSFCVLNEQYQYRTRTPQNIVAEIEYQAETHDTGDFIFVDTDVAGNKSRFTTLLTLLVEASRKRKKPYHFFAEISPLFLTEETAHLMQLASFMSTQMGFEGMADSLLKKMEKRHRVVHNIQALKIGKRFNLSLDGLNIIRGIPTESREDIMESIANVKFVRFLLNTYTLHPSTLELYKGSPFYTDMPEESRQKWRHNRFWEEISSSHLVSEKDRWEFFGFYHEKPSFLWDDFDAALALFTTQNRSYTWTHYRDGSFIEENGPDVLTYELDNDETDILIFCNSIKSISQIKEHTRIDEKPLLSILETLHEYGLLFWDGTHVVSVLESSTRRVST